MVWHGGGGLAPTFSRSKYLKFVIDLIYFKINMKGLWVTRDVYSEPIILRLTRTPPPPILPVQYTLKLSKTERTVIITEVYLYWEEGSQLKKIHTLNKVNIWV